MKYEAAIIGAGPAGVSCALELSLYGIECVIIESDEPGGLLNEAYQVRNVPFFKEPLKGSEIGRVFSERIKNSKSLLVKDLCTKIVQQESGGYDIQLFSGGTIDAKRVVVATGSDALDTPEIFSSIDRKYIYKSQRGLSCKLNGKVLIVGGGDTAFDFSLSLKERGVETAVMYRDKIKANSVLVKSAKEAGIEMIRGEAVHAEENNGEIIIKTCTNRFVVCSALIPAIGRQPKRGFECIKGKAGVYFAGDASGMKMCINECAAEGTRIGKIIAGEV